MIGAWSACRWKIVQVSHPMPDQITLRRKVYDVLETTGKAKQAKFSHRHRSGSF